MDIIRVRRLDTIKGHRPTEAIIKAHRLMVDILTATLTISSITDRLRIMPATA